jgi:riboflavin biosynthesis pyrimidine reductase
VRLCAGENPARVVIDPQGRLPDDAPMLADDGAPRIVVQAVGRVRPAGVKVLRLALRGGLLDPAEIAAALRAEGLHSLLIEGGGITIARFLEAERLTRLQVAIAPLLIGGGPQGLNLPTPTERPSPRPSGPRPGCSRSARTWCSTAASRRRPLPLPGPSTCGGWAVPVAER